MMAPSLCNLYSTSQLDSESFRQSGKPLTHVRFTKRTINNMQRTTGQYPYFQWSQRCFNGIQERVYQSIHACQHGYLSRLSCVSQLVEILATIGLHLDRGRQIDTIFLDMSKAFDKVSHRRLIAKLTHYGFGGNLLRWFTFYLSNCKRRVTIPGGPPGSHFRSHVVLAVCKWFARGCQIQSCGCICR